MALALTSDMEGTYGSAGKTLVSRTVLEKSATNSCRNKDAAFEPGRQMQSLNGCYQKSCGNSLPGHTQGKFASPGGVCVRTKNRHVLVAPAFRRAPYNQP